MGDTANYSVKTNQKWILKWVQLTGRKRNRYESDRVDRTLHNTEECLVRSDERIIYQQWESSVSVYWSGLLVDESHFNCSMLVHAGLGSTTVGSPQAMLCWWFIASSASVDVQGSPFVCALLCSFIWSCDVHPVLCLCLLVWALIGDALFYTYIPHKCLYEKRLLYWLLGYAFSTLEWF